MEDRIQLDDAFDPDEDRPVRSATDNLTYLIIGAAQKVHRTLGPGFGEHIYHRALARELMLRQLPFESEKELEVFYESYLCGTFKPDFIVGALIIVELKAVAELCADHWAQTKSYLKASGLDNALLMNFGGRSLETRRIFRKKKDQSDHPH